MISESEITLISKIERGRQRRLVFRFIDEKPKIVSQIMNDINKFIKAENDGKPIRLSDVSRTLRFLVDNKLAECLNPAQRGDSGILYKLTEKGLVLRKKLSV